eukprot:105824-Chlamydomonas_euryale.AAC.1
MDGWMDGWGLGPAVVVRSCQGRAQHALAARAVACAPRAAAAAADPPELGSVRHHQLLRVRPWRRSARRRVSCAA